ncbi:MAG: CRISPR-associated helicase Cas3' [Candidatus Woesearchaeota archaeon]
MDGFDLAIFDHLLAKDKRNEENLFIDHVLKVIKEVLVMRRYSINNLKNCLQNDYFSTDNFFKDLILASFLHDLGKIEKNFQKKLGLEEQHLEKIPFVSEHKDHEVLSFVYSFVFNLEIISKRSKEIRYAVLCHHKGNAYLDIFSYEEDQKLSKKVENLAKKLFEKKEENYGYFIFLMKLLILRIREKIGKEEITEEEKELVNEVLSKLDSSIINDKDEYLDSLENFEFLGYRNFSSIFNNAHLWTISGSLKRLDYSASARMEVEYNLKNVSVYEKIKEKFRTCGEKNSWQEQILQEISERMNKEDLKKLVLIAPTGSGKTEFSLLWNEMMGNRKIIYVLPLRAALNDLYKRFIDYFGEDNVSLMHSTSFLEIIECYNDYFLEVIEGYSNSDDQHLLASKIKEILISTKLFSRQVTLATPDSVLLTSSLYFGSDIIISAFTWSSVIIDEIQMYNPKQLSLIIKTIDQIINAGGNVLIMTATYPPYISKFLEDRGFKFIDLTKSEYAHLREKIKNYSLYRHVVKIYHENIENNSFEKLNEIVMRENDKKILIIVNTIAKAIKVFKHLEGKNLKNLYLLHGGLIEFRKAQVIKEIKQKIRDSEPIILVSTQVVEASVDVDFDILITELSPIDSQIQRWGRIYRNRQNSYESEEPNIHLFLYLEENQKVYDLDTIEATSSFFEKFPYEMKKMNYEIESALINKIFNSEEMQNAIDYNLKSFYNYKFIKRLIEDVHSFFRQNSEENITLVISNFDETLIHIFKNYIHSSYKDIENKVGISKWIILKKIIENSVSCWKNKREKIREISDGYEIKNEYTFVYIRDQKLLDEILKYGINIVWLENDEPLRSSH